MSNLKEFQQQLNQLGTSQFDAVQFIGGAIGTLADIAGGIGAAIDLYNFIAGLLNSGTDQTEQYLSDIKNTVQQIKVYQNASFLVNTWNDFDNQITDALGNYTNVLNLVKTIAENDITTREARVQQNQDAVQRFGLPSFWTMPYYDAGYLPTPTTGLSWQAGPAQPNFFYIGRLDFSENLPDAGPDFSIAPLSYAGPGRGDQQYLCNGLTFFPLFEPQPDSDGIIFSFIYILPYFMKTIQMYLAVGAALEPTTFVQMHADQIRSLCIQPLLAYHNQIKDGDQSNPGIVNVPAPSLDSFKPLPLNWPAPEWSWPQNKSGDFVLWNVPGQTYTFGYFFPQPFGAVSLYSGVSSLGSYPPLDPVPQDQTAYMNVFAKYLLRSLAPKKAVYRGIGLLTVWNTIKQLQTLVGDPVLGSSFGDWSLKEVYSLIGRL